MPWLQVILAVKVKKNMVCECISNFEYRSGSNVNYLFMQKQFLSNFPKEFCVYKINLVISLS